MARQLIAWFEQEARDLPWRHTRDPYPIWVSEIMLQQTQVKSVIPYWERWMGALPNVHALAAAPEATVLKLWEGLGYYRRARHLHAAAQFLVRHHRGQCPDTAEEWARLPGIGPYTAGAIASIAFNEPVPAVDGNVTRVLARLEAIDIPVNRSAARGLLWRLARQWVQTAAGLPPLAPHPRFPPCSAVNQGLMELGATVCTPSDPRCSRCPLQAHCQARKTQRVNALPVLPSRAPTRKLHRVTLLLEVAGRFLLCQRPPDVVNADLWEFPHVTRDPHQAAIATAARSWQLPETVLQPVGTLQHSITNHRITREIFYARLPHRPRQPRGRWVCPAALESLPLTAADRRLARRFLPPPQP